jgi:tetratricopeptide (TPR) repeat protein
LLSSGAAFADGKTGKVRALYEEGMMHYNLREFPEALASFREAYRLKPDPAFLFNMGQCHRMSGQWSEEVYAYRRYLADRPNAPNRPEVEQFIATAEEQIKRQAAAAPPTNTIPPETGPPTTPPNPNPTPAAPVVVAPTEPIPPPHTDTPVYRRWWLWTVVAVVVIGAGLGVGLTLGLSHDGPEPSTSGGWMAVKF